MWGSDINKQIYGQLSSYSGNYMLKNIFVRSDIIRKSSLDIDGFVWNKIKIINKQVREKCYKNLI
jgi:hypothetical protein